MAAKVLRCLRNEISELGFGVALEGHARPALTGKQIGESPASASQGSRHRPQRYSGNE
jgi:hypothetical protein